MTRSTLALVGTLLATAACGCGRSDDLRDVRSVTEAFLVAYAADAGDDACALLSTETREAVEDQEQKPCSQAVTDLQIDAGDVADVQVYVVNAKVELTSGDNFFLSEESEGWRVSALACRPDGGKPADRPFECEAEA